MLPKTRGAGQEPFHHVDHRGVGGRVVPACACSQSLFGVDDFLINCAEYSQLSMKF
jgi:hypothetical protein